MSHILEGYLTREELAKQLAVSTRTLARYESAAGGLPFTKIGGRTMYRISSVQSWIDSRESRPNPRRQRSS